MLSTADPTTHAATPEPHEKTTLSFRLIFFSKNIFFKSSLFLKQPELGSNIALKGILTLPCILPLFNSFLGSGSVPLNRPVGLASINLKFLFSIFFFISSNCLILVRSKLAL